jgi:hypothetical protein
MPRGRLTRRQLQMNDVTKRYSQRLQGSLCTFTKSDFLKDHRGVDLISDALPFGRLWYGEPDGLARPLDFIHTYGPIKTFGHYFAQIGEQLLLAGVLIPNHLSD